MMSGEEKELLQGLTVLYVEDDPLALTSISGFLARRVRTIHTASNGKEGLEVLGQHRVDVVITDLEMPVMNGLEMIRQIKTNRDDPPVIITTGYNDDEHKSELACRTILKPIDFKNLLEAIVFCVKLHRSREDESGQ